MISFACTPRVVVDHERRIRSFLSSHSFFILILFSLTAMVSYIPLSYHLSAQLLRPPRHKAVPSSSYLSPSLTSPRQLLRPQASRLVLQPPLPLRVCSTHHAAGTRVCNCAWKSSSIPSQQLQLMIRHRAACHRPCSIGVLARRRALHRRESFELRRDVNGALPRLQ